ncbi:MAG: argininosuccinate lyase [Anaerolineales bacterium]
MNADRAVLGVGDRLREPPSPALVQTAFAQEAAYGPWLHQGMSLADLAHVVMLIEQAVIPRADGGALLYALLTLYETPVTQLTFDPALGDPYSNHEHLLRKQCGEAVGWLAAGRARRESATVGFTLTVRRALLEASTAAIGLLRALMAQAEQHLTTLLPDYTYLQIAQPTSLAHYLLTFAAPLVRDLDRLRLAFEHVDECPAGIGSTNGSGLPLNRERVAQLLGFARVAEHTRDAMWRPDAPIEVLGALTALWANADRLAEDLLLWATDEFGFIELADRHARISVIMPNKKNPYSLAYVRGAARELLGQFVSVAAGQMTPSAQVENRIFAYSAVPHALRTTANALRLLAEVISEMIVDVERMAQRAGEAFSGATDLAEVIMMHSGVTAQTAHRIVARAVRLAEEAGRGLDAALLDEAAQVVIERALTMDAATLESILDPRAIVATRTTVGGAAPEPLHTMLTAFRQTADEHAERAASQRQRITLAEEVLLRTARTLCPPT